MIDIHRLPGAFPDLYTPHSDLADAKIPMGATLTHIYMARAWRFYDSHLGAGHSRRARIRARKLKREPLSFDHMLRVDDPRRTHTVPTSHKGYAA